MGITRGQRISDEQRAHVLRLRRAATPAECAAWAVLRNRQCHGLKFCRGQCVCGVFVDFYCAALRLALEIDGRVHDEPAQTAYDAERTAMLACHGIEVVRIRNEVVGALRLREVVEEALARHVSSAAGGRR